MIKIKPLDQVHNWNDLYFFEQKMDSVVMHRIKDTFPNRKYLPEESMRYNAFKYTPFDKVKVVLLGQDPYPDKNNAMGLAFSVKPSVQKLPGSLRNIFYELKTDLGIIRKNGDLTDWTTQGVLLLNTALTTNEGDPKSHSKMGWNELTKEVIATLNAHKEHIVFILLGNEAKEYKQYIDEKKHYIIESGHPSPFSAKLFYGCKLFSKTNDYLAKYNIDPIKW